MRLPCRSLVRRTLSIATLAALSLAMHIPSAAAQTTTAITCTANVTNVKPVSNTTLAAMHGTRCSAPTTIIVWGAILKDGVVITRQQKTCENTITCSFYNYVPYGPGTYFARTRGSTPDPNVAVSWVGSDYVTY